MNRASDLVDNKRLGSMYCRRNSGVCKNCLKACVHSLKELDRTKANNGKC